MTQFKTPRGYMIIVTGKTKEMSFFSLSLCDAVDRQQDWEYSLGCCAKISYTYRGVLLPLPTAEMPPM